jgi:hypothetical protein
LEVLGEMRAEGGGNTSATGIFFIDTLFNQTTDEATPFYFHSRTTKHRAELFHSKTWSGVVPFYHILEPNATLLSYVGGVDGI